jgi:hypothetical protein
VAQTRQEQPGGQHIDTRGGQFQCQRQSIQALANRGDRLRILGRERETRIDCACALYKEGHRRDLAQRLQITRSNHGFLTGDFSFYMRPLLLLAETLVKGQREHKQRLFTGFRGA